MKPQYSRYYTFIKPVLRNKYVKTYSSAVFSIITITIFSLFAIKPTVSTIVSLQKSIEEQNQLLVNIEQKTKSLTLAKNNYDSLPNGTKDNLESLIPNYTSLPELVDSITSVIGSYQASSSGIQIEKIDLEGPPQTLIRKPETKEIAFLVNVQGSYPQLSGLLDKLSKSNRLIKIDTINFNKSEEGSLIMSLSGKAYYFKN